LDNLEVNQYFQTKHYQEDLLEIQLMVEEWWHLLLLQLKVEASQDHQHLYQVGGVHQELQHRLFKVEV